MSALTLTLLANLCDAAGAPSMARGVREMLANGRDDEVIRTVCRTKSKSNVVVSTMWAGDCLAYETALLDANGVHPVERYADDVAAMQGHHRWLAFADDCDGKEITVLGDADGIIPPHKATLEAVS
jgi:hypothetical protein